MEGVDRYVGRLSVDIGRYIGSFSFSGQPSTDAYYIEVARSVIYRSSTGRLSIEHRSCFGRVSVDLWPIVGLLKVKNDHRSKFSNLSNWKEEA